MSGHLRSTSLPSRPHSSEIKVEEELHSLRTCLCRQPATMVTLCDGLRRLADVYNCVEEIVRLPRNQVGLCSPQQQKVVEKELERSLVLLDICNAMQENFAELKMGIQELLLVRKRGDHAIVNLKVESFFRSAKNMRKHFRKYSSKATSEGLSFVRLLAEAREMAISLFESASYLLPKKIITSDSSKWFLVSKKFQKKEVIHTEDRLQALECRIGDLENGAGFLFRRLIQTRVSLLNILSSSR
ncbi:uncharacterized protein [Lolium perenne]|uniref:uncharacterized protein n=1 Tax=Lolium perenne TaxID=4522 RepID=UPI0021F579D7|nr:uncharacterized protein LOC127294269 [Lolium perenne]